MFRGPLFGIALATLLAGAAPGHASKVQAGPAAAQAQPEVVTRLNALDGRLLADPPPGSSGWDASGPGPPSLGHDPGAVYEGDGGLSSDPAGHGREMSVYPMGGVAADPLPLGAFVRDAKGGRPRRPATFWEMMERVRYDGLPEPASWALVLVGFGMIGGALRGFMLANRRLARLRADEAE
jgi:hypothetical protein